MKGSILFVYLKEGKEYKTEEIYAILLRNQSPSQEKCKAVSRNPEDIITMKEIFRKELNSHYLRKKKVTVENYIWKVLYKNLCYRNTKYIEKHVKIIWGK